jgi:hypothetical protein
MGQLFLLFDSPTVPQPVNGSAWELTGTSRPVGESSGVI